MRLRLTYLLVAAVLFALLALIALHLEGGIIRTHGGDVLVVAWLYASGRAVTLWRPSVVAVLVFVIAALIELGQAAALIERLGLLANGAAQLALGRYFDPWDLVAYASGAAVAWLLDRRWNGLVLAQ